MGSCVSSSQSKSSSASDSVVKLAAFISKPDTTSPLKTDVMITSSTINGIPPTDSGRRDSGILFDHYNTYAHNYSLRLI